MSLQTVWVTSRCLLKPCELQCDGKSRATSAFTWAVLLIRPLYYHFFKLDSMKKYEFTKKTCVSLFVWPRLLCSVSIVTVTLCTAAMKNSMSKMSFSFTKNLNILLASQHSAHKFELDFNIAVCYCLKVLSFLLSVRISVKQLKRKPMPLI